VPLGRQVRQARRGAENIRGSMQQNADDWGAREAELLEVLSAYAEPRAVSFRFVVAFVLLGLLGCASLAWLAAGAPAHEPLRFEPEPAASFQRGIGAFRAADWDAALKLMREARAAAQRPLPRVEDYIERLELILRDEERLSRAQQALEASEPERALGAAALIAANSPLFAQAEGLSRRARAQLQAVAPTPAESAGPVALERAGRAGSATHERRRPKSVSTRPQPAVERRAETDAW
jgi:hypothetical protein